MEVLVRKRLHLAIACTHEVTIRVPRLVGLFNGALTNSDTYGDLRRKRA